jgi:16S rRNA processing protein RimM
VSGAHGRLIKLGRIVGLHGVRGWIKVHSDTRPRENIFKYRTWYVGRDGAWREIALLAGRPSGKGLVAQLAEVTDRDQARELIGAEIAVPAADLPPPEPGEVYWWQLEGLRVENLAGIELGVIQSLFETGANDVMVVVQGDMERLIPYVPQVVREVDLDTGVMRVDWEADF